MRGVRRLGCVAIAIALPLACGRARPRLVPGNAATASSSAASASASASASVTVEELEAPTLPPPERWTWGAIACWVGPPWAEALGALGEERGLLTARRCRRVAHEALGVAENDEQALRAMGEVDARTSEAVAAAIASKAPPSDPRPGLVRAVAEACREGREMRRAAQALRAKGAKLDAGAEEALRDERALTRLGRLELGARTPAVRLVALVLAADRVEVARDLPPRARLLATAPALSLVFGVAAPAASADGADAKVEETYVALLEEAARRGGQSLAPKPGDPLPARARTAGLALAVAFADRFDALVPKLPEREPSRVARGYALRVRQALEAERNRLGASCALSSSSSFRAGGDAVPCPSASASAPPSASR
jgi:hypothetical protein